MRTTVSEKAQELLAQMVTLEKARLDGERLADELAKHLVENDSARFGQPLFLLVSGGAEQLAGLEQPVAVTIKDVQEIVELAQVAEA